MLIRHILLVSLIVTPSTIGWTILPDATTTAFPPRRRSSRRLVLGRPPQQHLSTPTHLSVSSSSSSSSTSLSSSSSAAGSGKLLQKKKKLTSFPRYLEVECWKRQDLRGLESVLQSFAEACKQISRIVQRAQTDDVYGGYYDTDNANVDAGGTSSNTIKNVQGEVQQKLDVLCNTILLRAFCGGGRQIHSVASEEEDDPRCCSDVMVRCVVMCFCGVCLPVDPLSYRIGSFDHHVTTTTKVSPLIIIILLFMFVYTYQQGDAAFASGDYIAVFDPLDGSANIDASLPVGTIFGIYRKRHGDDITCHEMFQQDGSQLVAAGYCLFSYVYNTTTTKTTLVVLFVRSRFRWCSGLQNTRC
jgi:fructose-1,6-bisphosphatase I